MNTYDRYKTVHSPIGVLIIALLAAFQACPALAQDKHEVQESTGQSREASQNLSRLSEKVVTTATGKEDWTALTGFGKDAGMAEMMTLMMVGGSGMERMKMSAMMSAMKSNAKPAALPAMHDSSTKAAVDDISSAGWTITVNSDLSELEVGKNMLDVSVLDPNGKPVTGAKVVGAIEMTSMDMGVTKPTGKEGKSGHYRLPVQLSMKGPWRIGITVTPPRRKSFSRSYDVKVAQ